jgi:ACS family hexuronate transporter-like MFS transporter
LRAREAAYIREGDERPQDIRAASIAPLRPRWIELLLLRQTWAVIVPRLLVDPVWWLYILWLPEYLHKVRGLSMQQIGVLASLPFIAAGLGGLAGGALSAFLLGRGWSLNWARKSIILMAAGLMSCGVPAARAEHTAEAIAWISVVTFGFQMWISNVQILPSDLFPSEQVASVAGLGGVGAGLGSMAFTLTTGWVVDHYSYGPILVAGGLLGPLGTLALLFLLGRVERITKD